MSKRPEAVERNGNRPIDSVHVLAYRGMTDANVLSRGHAPQSEV